MKSNIIAIDPGKNGGITAITSEGVIIRTIKMPETAQDILLELNDILKQTGPTTVCFLEKVGGQPGNGGSRAFNFGKLYGYIEMALAALKIKTVLVTPQKWQKEFQLGTKSGSASNTEWKNKLKAEAQRLFPNLKITLALSDSMLLAEYGRITLSRSN